MADAPSLIGPLARIERANEHIRHLNDRLVAFVRSRPYTAVPQPDPNPFNRAFLITEVKPIPLQVRVMIGEIPHHLRAALDLLVCQLLLRENVTDPKILKKREFPIFFKRDLSIPKVKKEHEADIARKIKGVGPKPYALIESLQPCVAGNGDERSHLAQVAELDNTDKHRLLLAAVGSMHFPQVSFHDAGTVVAMADAYVALKEGATLVLSPFNPGVNVDTNFTNAVAFDEPGPVFGHPVVPTLQNLSDLTRDTVNLFADCF
jgi:hypothetical protein